MLQKAVCYMYITVYVIYLCIYSYFAVIIGIKTFDKSFLFLSFHLRCRADEETFCILKKYIEYTRDLCHESSFSHNCEYMRKSNGEFHLNLFKIEVYKMLDVSYHCRPVGLIYV